MDYAHQRDNVQASNTMSAPPYPPKYVMLNNEQTPGNLRPPPQRRNLPRYHSQHPQFQKSSANGCLKCICCCYCCLFSLILILTIVAYILYATFKPQAPKYNFENFQVKAFNVLPDFSINAELTAVVKANNPNDHIAFEYGKDSMVIVNYTGITLCSGKLPAFRQPNNNITIFNVELQGQAEFSSGLQESLMADREAGRIPLFIMIKAPVVVVIGSFPLREIVAKINCSLVVDDLGVDKKINILSSKYNYDVSS